LKIGGHKYKVIFTDLDDMGKTDRVKNIIYIDKSLPKSQQEATLVHEIFHTLNNELDHPLLDSLSEQWFSVLKANQWILNYFQKGRYPTPPTPATSKPR
jgi:hypothetical protein